MKKNIQKAEAHECTFLLITNLIKSARISLLEMEY